MMVTVCDEDGIENSVMMSQNGLLKGKQPQPLLGMELEQVPRRTGDWCSFDLEMSKEPFIGTHLQWYPSTNKGQQQEYYMCRAKEGNSLRLQTGTLVVLKLTNSDSNELVQAKVARKHASLPFIYGIYNNPIILNGSRDKECTMAMQCNQRSSSHSIGVDGTRTTPIGPQHAERSKHPFFSSSSSSSPSSSSSSFDYKNDKHHYRFAIVMEHLGDGVDAISHISHQQRGFTQEEAAPMFKAMTQTVQCLHQEGYTHLDIKPERFFISKDRFILLVDLDNALRVEDCPSRVAPSRFLHHLQAGITIQYSAPELIAFAHKQLREPASWVSHNSTLDATVTNAKLTLTLSKSRRKTPATNRSKTKSRQILFSKSNHISCDTQTKINSDMNCAEIVPALKKNAAPPVPLDQRADIYSLGAAFLVLLTSSLPHAKMPTSLLSLTDDNLSDIQKLNFTVNRKEALDPIACSFLELFLQPHPCFRHSLSDILSHPFLNSK
eukprot:m.60027 g.60027  ORF g.60027 m.60027 type:complete len:493 (+) comp11347_c0_seq1:309-1787(+)